MQEKNKNIECPCKRIKCERHGDCNACKEHHNNFKQKMNVACERLKNSKDKKK